MHSCIYQGWVRHRRRTPVAHQFQYRLFMMYLDLAELPTLFSRRWLWSVGGFGLARFRRADHLKGVAPATMPLDQAVRDFVEQRTGKRPAGPIRLLTHLEYFGFRFNPVSFYYCFDASGERVEATIAEINNTPWGEQHCYVLAAPHDSAEQRTQRFRFAKEFHISPFMGMDHDYDWRFARPAANLAIHMQNFERGELLFDATMSLRRREITGPALAGLLIRFPFMTARVLAAIYYQALRLWLKRCRYFPHPGSRVAT